MESTSHASSSHEVPTLVDPIPAELHSEDSHPDELAAEVAAVAAVEHSFDASLSPFASSKYSLLIVIPKAGHKDLFLQHRSQVEGGGGAGAGI